jgi:hypothetical protein
MVGSISPESRTPLLKRRIAFSRLPLVDRLMATRQLAELSRNSGSFTAVVAAIGPHEVLA